jgi:transposase-like protein
MATQQARRSSGARDHSTPRRVRRFPAPYKTAILEEYASLDRAGRTALLRRENLRSGLLSQWRRQARRGSIQALSTEPGGQPVRKIHFSESLWSELTEAGAQASPPMTPERLLRALASWYVGRTGRLPGPGPDGDRLQDR